MQLDFRGRVVPFADVRAGEFFIFYDDKTKSYGMKIIYDGEPAALSFTRATQPNVTPPAVITGEALQDRHVCVLDDAVFRPDFTGLEAGSPPSANRPGPVIVAEDGTFVRACLAERYSMYHWHLAS
jgi:hypothetical protein